MSKSTFKFALLGAFAALETVVSAVTAEDVTKPMVWNKTDGGTFNYRYHEPQTKESGKTYPLVIFCHGAGERGTDNSKQLYYCANEIVNWFGVNDQEMYFVAGQVPKEKRWVEVDWTEKWRDQPVEPSETMTGLIELIEHLFATEQIDRSRVYITGISMGGFGTWDLMCRKGSDWFAAGMPVCGGGDMNKVSRITDIPIRTFHGGADPIVPVENSRTMVTALKAAGGDITYTEIPGAGHDVWTSTYGNMENLNWLFTQKNPKYVKSAVTAWASKHGTFAKRIAFTAGGYAGSSWLYDFPVLVRLSTAVSGFSYSDCAEGKFVFTDAYGNRIPHEVDSWNVSGTSLVWVRLPELQKNTTFYMYFDGEPGAANTSSATWTAYSGVWHMKEASGTGVADSADGEFGTMSVSGKTTNGAQESVIGVFGSARTTATAMSGKSFLSVAQNSDASTRLGPSFSVSGWVKCASEPTSLVPFMSRKPGLNWQSGWEVALAGSSRIWVGGQLDKPNQGTGLTATASEFAVGAWTHIAVVYSTAYNNTESKATVYVNGSTDGVSCTGSIQIPKNAGTSGFSFGGREYDDFSLVGSFDELRYRNGVIGADWVKAEYDQSGTAFLSNGGVEVSGGQQEDPPQEDPPQEDPQQEDPQQEDPADALLPSGGDDTAAIKSAISGAAAGDVITLGSGVFSVSDELMLGNAVVLKGQGWAKTVIKQTGSGKRVATLDGGAKVQGVTLTGGSISGNGYTGVKGAGVLVKNGTISWCCISNNTATAYNCNGGGVSFDGGQGRIDHSIVANNTVTHATQTGVYGAGIGFTSASGEVVIDTCLVYGNAAATQGENIGGGIFVSSEYAIQILNTTVTGNVAGNKAGGIGFGSVKSGSFVLKNCIVAGNTVGGSENNVGFLYSFQKTNVQNGSSYCLFGLADEVMGTASVSGDPGFVDAAADDYRLSAAKELGCSTTESLLDLDGCGRTGALDVGCYEFGGTKPEPQDDPPHEDPPQDEPHQDDPHQDDPPQDDPSAALLPSGGDDTAAIQSAITAASAGDVVALGSGVFCISEELIIGNGITLEGRGFEKTVIKQTGAGKRVATLEGGSKIQGVTLTGGSISGNGYAGVKGAGVLVKNGTISWCCISNNTATAYNCNGGGVSFDGGQGRIDHSIVANNTVAHSTQTGVGGAGIGFAGTSGDVVIDTCLVYGNAATTKGENVGGGIFASSESAIQILNTTVTGNVAGDKAGGIGFGSVKSGSFVLKNCIVAGNTVGGSENNVGFQYSFQKTNVQNGSSYCLFGLADEVIGTASASGDPGFVNDATGDYRLSAAKELGYSTTESLLDLDGCGRTGALDVGCYEFGGTKPEPQPEPIVLGTPAVRPSTNYNGSAVKVSVTGDFPDGAAVSAKVTIAGGDYAGTVMDGVVSFAIPDTVVTAGNVYTGTITLTVGNEDYTKAVTLAQGTLKLDEKTDWIAESAAAFGATGTWNGDRAEPVGGTKIAVSNAAFTVATPSPVEANISVTTVVNFQGATERPFDPAMKASVQVVKVAGVNRYAFLTCDGAVTNLTAVANVSSESTVKFDLDYTAETVTYTIDGTAFGPFAAPAAGAKSVSGVRYDGATEVASLVGSYRFEGLDANLAKVGGVEYATVAEAIAEAGSDTVQLLWDASWEPSAAGEYAVATNDHTLAIGGPLAWSVKDNDNGTLTVTVTGGESSEAPAPASITFSGSTVKVGVSDVKPDLWYALEKTTDLTKPFVVDETTWTKGSDLIGGDKELAIMLRASEPQAFYRVVVSKTAK